MGIIPGGSSAGGTYGTILHLPDALKMYPECGIEFYNRNSSWGQAGKGKTKLHEKTYAAVNEVRKLAPLKLRRIVQGVEEGKLSRRRPKLRDAVGYAKQRGLMLVTIDLSRFIRSESYCRQTNPEAWPTHEEFDQLSEMASGVILATLEDPMLTESERQSKATKRTRKCGRPPEIDPKLAFRILEALGWPIHLPGGRMEWEVPLSEVAKRFRISKPKVQRLVEARVPEQLCDGVTGLKWKDLRDPARAYREAQKRGLIPDKTVSKR